MSLPRRIVPETFYLLTRRCSQRQFLLRPDKVTNQTFEYCLAEAAQRFGILVLLPLAMSNHHHTVLYDPNGTIAEFMAHFHKMVAKAMNAHRGRWENLWSIEPPCLVELGGVEDVIAKLLYTALNPVIDGLVTRADEWPGFSGVEAFLSGTPIVATRPAHFFRKNGTMPETVTLELVVPPALGDAAEFRALIRRLIAAAEELYAARRRATGQRVLGAAAVRRQSWRGCPDSRELRRGLRPRVAARFIWRRIETLQRNADFQRDYRIAYRAWRAGEPAVFPAGTYWLAHFANVPVAAEKVS